MNIFHLGLELIELRLSSGSVFRVLESLDKAIEECDAHIGRAARSKNADYYEGVVDDECAVIENVLGAAYVTCQAEITVVVSRVMWMHEMARNAGKQLACSTGRKRSILQLGNDNVGTSGFTKVQVIDAFANYFKHHEEWSKPWSEYADDDREKATIEIISAVGGQENNTGIFRDGAEALGLVDYRPIRKLAEYIHDWIKVVGETYEKELKRVSLV